MGLSGFARSTLNKVFPDHWSFLLGEVAMYSFVVLLVTGVFLTFFFQPSLELTTYDGSYEPMRGIPMTQAYESTLRLSFDVRAGLVMRQIHHWAAIVFLIAVVVHLLRIFFTGAFRRPREINWLIGVTLMLLALGNGFTGYSLPDDLLSGTGLRIMYSIVLSIPFIGTWLAFLLFGGEFPAHDIIGRLYIIHVLLIPAGLAGLLGAHLGIVWRQKHTQFPGEGRTERNVVGTRFWPTYTTKSVALLALQVGVLALMGGFAQINPIWLYGPFEAAAVSTAAQPDWYVGFLEGALRLFPPWDFHLFGHTISEVFLPGVVLPGITFGAIYAWPFIEKRFTKDDEVHHLLDRPRDRPHRTAFGAAVVTFYVMLTLGGGQDIIAQKLNISVIPVLWTLRILVLVSPPLVYLITWKICRDLLAASGPPETARTALEPREEPEAESRAAKTTQHAPEPVPVEPVEATAAAGSTAPAAPTEPAEIVLFDIEGDEPPYRRHPAEGDEDEAALTP